MSVVTNELDLHVLECEPEVIEQSPVWASNPSLPSLLDWTEHQLRFGLDDPRQVKAALATLFETLQQERARASESEWRRIVAGCRTRPLRELLHEDPFTGRAFNKPRGYAGDAVLMDYIYGPEDGRPQPEASELGRMIFEFTTSAPASQGVRARRRYMANVIDRLAEETRRPHVLSLAAGHLREADLASAVRQRRLGRFVALDADRLSLEEIQRCYGEFGVETVPANLRLLLLGKRELGEFDLIYSTGLFDYLADSTGRRLVTAMFQMLRPGGRLVVANFLPGIRDVGYMETYMDWTLIYRDRQDMVRLTLDLPETQIAGLRLHSEENRNILFLEVTKA